MEPRSIPPARNPMLRRALPQPVPLLAAFAVPAAAPGLAEAAFGAVLPRSFALFEGA